MTRLKRWFWWTPVLLTLGWMQANAGNPLPYKWEHGYAFFYYNPDNLPDHIAADDPRVVDAEDLSEEEVLELRTQIVEEMIRKGLRTWSSVNDTTLVATYAGRTDADCQDLSDDVPVICWRKDTEHFKRTREDGETYYAWATVMNRADGGLIKDSRLFLNLEAMTSRWLPSFLLHEQGHNLGLGHYDEEPAVMNTSFHHIIMTPGLRFPDEAGIYHHYPFTQDCAPTIEMLNGRLSFEVQVYLDGHLYRGRLDHHYDGSRDTLAINRLYDDPYGDGKSCAVKVVDGELNIPYIWYLGELHYLNAVLRDDGAIEIVDYGLAQ